MAICFCGICIPYSAVFALFAVVTKPLISVLARWGIIPLWMARKFGIYIEKNNSCCNSTHVGLKDSKVDSSSSNQGQILAIQSKDHFHLITSSSKVIVKFTATWCKPCKVIQPIYERLALENTSIQFCSVDVDELDDVAGTCGKADRSFHFQKKHFC
jgi:thioredoxin 1